MKRLIPIIFACAALSSCTSPEATRARGGGPGADVNNRPAEVKMHEGSRQYYETPVRIRAESPPLAPSEQARQLSLPGKGGQQRSDGGQQ
jgi:hypothetical protein